MFQPLLNFWNVLHVLDDCFHGTDGVECFNIQGDGFHPIWHLHIDCHVSILKANEQNELTTNKFKFKFKSLGIR